MSTFIFEWREANTDQGKCCSDTMTVMLLYLISSYLVCQVCQNLFFHQLKMCCFDLVESQGLTFVGYSQIQPWDQDTLCEMVHLYNTKLLQEINFDHFIQIGDIHRIHCSKAPHKNSSNAYIYIYTHLRLISAVAVS